MAEDDGSRDRRSDDTWAELAGQTEPGEPHRFLGRLAGRWRVRSRAWPTPDAEPVESECVKHGRPIYGGRFLIEELSGDYRGRRVEGMQLLGYDGYLQRFDFTSISSLGTATYRATGELDGSGNVLTLAGEIDDAMGKRPVRHVIEIRDTDRHRLTAYTTLDDGEEVVAVETECERISDDASG
jgi:hypothetical protein